MEDEFSTMDFNFNPKDAGCFSVIRLGVVENLKPEFLFGRRKEESREMSPLRPVRSNKRLDSISVSQCVPKAR
jgi:hypothetical protein